MYSFFNSEDEKTYELEDANMDPAEKKKKVEKIIQDHVVWAMGAGLIPIPLMDIAAVTAVQLDMIKKISKVYEQEFSEVQVKAWVSTLAGGVGVRMAADTLKFIPGFGSLIGGISMSMLSGATTYGFGKVFATHFESGGTLINFDPEKAKSYFADQFRQGKEYAAKMKDQFSKKQSAAKKQAPDANEQMIQKLKDLATLRDSGAISEEEYAKLKDKLLSQI